MFIGTIFIIVQKILQPASNSNHINGEVLILQAMSHRASHAYKTALQACMHVSFRTVDD